MLSRCALFSRWNAVLGLLLAAQGVAALGHNPEPLDAAASAPQSRTRAANGTVSNRSKATRRVSRRPAPPPPLVGTAPSGTAALVADLSHLLQAKVKRGAWGVAVTSISRGDALFLHNADVSLLPASTLKLFTTALAFERLGVHHQFSTDLLRDGTVGPDGTLSGALVLRGGGDPALASRFFGDSPESPMRTLAQILVKAGVKRVTGDLIVDASAFESRTIPDGWLARYLDHSYASRVSALSLNSNLLHVAVTPGKGQAAAITLRPEVTGYRVDNRATVRAGSRGARLSVGRLPSGDVFVRGWIGSRSQVRVYTVVVDEPARFAAAAFRKALERDGIVVTGDTRFAPAPHTAQLVGSLPSPPLYQLASIMNGESDNHFAELLLRNAARGREQQSVGSAALANEQMQVLLAERAGVSANALHIADGSGLSSKDRITSRAMTQLLTYAHRAPWAREFHQSLPVAGQSETLRYRMVATAAQGNIHAKTGTTGDVVALSGYATSRSGELLAFSFLYNGQERWSARETIDAMGATLAGFSR